MIKLGSAHFFWWSQNSGLPYFRWSVWVLSAARGPARLVRSSVWPWAVLLLTREEKLLAGQTTVFELQRTRLTPNRAYDELWSTTDQFVGSDLEYFRSTSTCEIRHNESWIRRRSPHYFISNPYSKVEFVFHILISSFHLFSLLNISLFTSVSGWKDGCIEEFIMDLWTRFKYFRVPLYFHTNCIESVSTFVHSRSIASMSSRLELMNFCNSVL